MMESGKEHILGNEMTSSQSDSHGSDTEAKMHNSPKSTSKVYHSFNSRVAKTIGIIQLVSASVALLLNVALFLLNDALPYWYSMEVEGERRDYYWRNSYAYYFFPGVWAGLIVCGSGISMLCSGKTKSVSAIVALFVFSILGDLCGLGMIALSCWALKVDIFRVTVGLYYELPDRGYDHMNFNQYGMPDVAAPRAMATCVLSILFAVTSLVIFGTCIKATIMSARVIKIKDLKCSSPCTCLLYVSSGKDNVKPTVIFLGPQNDQQPEIIHIRNKKYTLTPIIESETNEVSEIEPLMTEEVA